MSNVFSIVFSSFSVEFLEIKYWSSPSFSFNIVDGEPDLSSVAILCVVTDDYHIISLKQ